MVVFGLQAAEPGYTDPAACRPCHQEIFDSYAQTGMGRSFARSSLVPPGRIDHPASQRSYEVVRRGGETYLRRQQAGGVNVLEKRIDYVIGSGNHSRTYLHQASDGRLLELPLSWYAERGGHWAMSPGYDVPNHADFRREVSQDCLFCHNGYPSKANGGIAQGIDCQRCHGPGEAHVARKGPIVNPAKLSPERRMEVCLQCHLESTSRRIPYAIRRYDRGPFSYRPGEPLEKFTIHFDEKGGQGDTFEVNHSAYRLRLSKCFVQSKGRMSCTTCHDPHRVMRGTSAEPHFTKVCRSCHASSHEPATTGCTGCHMPQRRTEDAPHIAMTDHRIRLKDVKVTAAPPRTGEVVVLYPPDLADTPENRLYLAAAQVKEFSNLKGGIPLLENLIAKASPQQGEFYLDLGEAYWRVGRLDDAIREYRHAIARRPGLTKAYVGLGESLMRKGDAASAVKLLEPVGSKDAGILNTLAVAYGQLGQLDRALELLKMAVAVDPENPPSWVNLGVAREHAGDRSGAIDAYREAIRLQPDFEEAVNRLKKLN